MWLDVRGREEEVEWPKTFGEAKREVGRRPMSEVTRECGADCELYTQESERIFRSVSVLISVWAICECMSIMTGQYVGVGGKAWCV